MANVAFKEGAMKKCLCGIMATLGLMLFTVVLAISLTVATSVQTALAIVILTMLIGLVIDLVIDLWRDGYSAISSRPKQRRHWISPWDPSEMGKYLSQHDPTGWKEPDNLV
jgi:hypothetical protein